MAMSDKLTAFQLMRAGLESEVKARITEDIINEQVEMLKVRLLAELQPILQAVTFECIESQRDLMRMRDEIRVCINVNDSVFDSKGEQQ